MRRGRKPDTPGADPEFAELVAGLYYAFEDNLERVAPGEAVTEELGHGFTADIARRVEDLDGKRADRVKALLP